MLLRRFSLCGLPAAAALLPVSALLVLLRAAHLQAVPSVRYVAPGGACGGQVPCYANVQTAVDAAQPGDEIRLAAGVYTGAHATAGLTQVVYISTSLTLRGGYAPANWQHTYP